MSSFFSHDHPSSTCTCKDRKAHRKNVLALVNARLDRFDKARTEIMALERLNGPIPKGYEVRIDWEAVPESLQSYMEGILFAYRSGDRIATAQSLVDLACACLLVFEESAHWDIPNEDKEALDRWVRAMEERAGAMEKRGSASSPGSE